MIGSLVRRERRPLWATLTFILAVAIGFSVYAAAGSRARLTADAEGEARLVAQTRLAPMLQPRDLEEPIQGDRASELGKSIQDTITSVGPIQDLTIYAPTGRVLYDADPNLVGTRPSSLTDFLFEVANTTTRSTVVGGELQTFVPIWLKPGGTVVVAELSQPFAPITSQANLPWYRLEVALGALVLVTLTLFGLTLRIGAYRPGMSRGADEAPRKRARDQQVAGPDSPMYQHAGFRQLEEERRDAARRADAAEANFRGLQQQFKSTLTEVKTSEAKLETKENEMATLGAELQALRDQPRDTAGRLHKAELDNNAMRERLALRNTELEQVKGQLTSMGGRDGESHELRKRLDAAERRAAEMEREVERIERELDYTSSRFHMTKLSEALRELDNGVVIEGEDEEDYDHPRVIIGDEAGKAR